MDDFYTLRIFANRCAVLGWRSRDTDILADGLTAIAMIEIARIDWRDAIGPSFIIFAVFHQLGVDPIDFFINAANNRCRYRNGFGLGSKLQSRTRSISKWNGVRLLLAVWFGSASGSRSKSAWIWAKRKGEK
jgi:hypothetical protein